MVRKWPVCESRGVIVRPLTGMAQVKLVQRIRTDFYSEKVVEQNHLAELWWLVWVIKMQSDAGTFLVNRRTGKGVTIFVSNPTLPAFYIGFVTVSSLFHSNLREKIPVEQTEETVDNTLETV